LTLDGETLTTADLYRASKGEVTLELGTDARTRAGLGRDVVDRITKTGEVVYGINTGFGLFSNVTVEPEQLSQLQVNLIRSHACGVGTPLTMERTRMLLALRINVLAKGHSGISLRVVDQMIAAWNKSCIPVVPQKGTVGASGDLAPLSHLALGLMGEGMMWDPRDGQQHPAADVLAAHGLRPIELTAKEGLAMINGTQLIASLGSEAVERADNVIQTADVVTAMTLEALCGTVRAYHPLIHAARPHRGQQLVAARVRHLLQPDSPSKLFQSHGYKGKVQDAYSLRCAPQVHGIGLDTVQFVRGVLETELNSATDNPMVFTQAQVDASEPMGFVLDRRMSMASPKALTGLPPGFQVPAEKPLDASDVSDLDEAKAEIARLRKAVAGAESNSWNYKKISDTSNQTSGGMIISGGNFHGEYPAKVCDMLAIGVSELAAISERRIERMCNPTLSGLPAFLVKDGGFNSGFMIAHCTAAGLVSENKVLCHPASCDSISTSAAKEDHVSMGGFAARKAVEVVEHVEMVIAIELLAACQAIEFHRPLTTTPPLERVHKLVRSKVAPWDQDRIMYIDMEAVCELVRSGAVLAAAKEGIENWPEG
jgi:histidine ammonia-lyase